MTPLLIGLAIACTLVVFGVLQFRQRRQRVDFIDGYPFSRAGSANGWKRVPAPLRRRPRSRLRRAARVLPPEPQGRPAPAGDALTGGRCRLARVHPVHPELRGVLPRSARTLPASHADRSDAVAHDGERRHQAHLATGVPARRHRSAEPLSAVPLLFAIDARLAIPDGFSYTLDCSALVGAAGSKRPTAQVTSAAAAAAAAAAAEAAAAASGDGGGCGGGGGD